MATLRKKMICQLFHILGEAISSEVCRLTPISGLFRRPRTHPEAVNDIALGPSTLLSFYSGPRRSIHLRCTLKTWKQNQ